MHGALSPGQWVKLPARPEWGIGQVQSVVRERVTVNFENAGKRVIDTVHAVLEPELPGQSTAGQSKDCE